MTDVALNKQLKVEIPYENAWPCISLSMNQLEALKSLLDSKGIRYWVSEHSFSWNNGPYVTELNFYRDVDPTEIQALLDKSN